MTTVRDAALPDAWWPIAFGAEIGQHPKAFRLGEQNFAVYRDLGGVVRAVDDACPHRRLPLSMGRLTEDGYLQCAYHGWCYDGATGQCTAIPNLSREERVPRGVKVRAFATVENIADVLGWGIRTPALAPRVGPPTGEEPDQGTTMSSTSIVGPFVFVWSGDRPSSAEPLPPTLDQPVPQSTTVTGTSTVRAPHAEVCDALVWNPGKFLGQSWLVGGGDEARGPLIERDGTSVTVRRRRRALDPPRISTFGPAGKRLVDSVTTTDAVTGVTSIVVAASGPVPTARIVVAMTPIGRYRTEVRWSTAFDGSGWRRHAVTATAHSARLHPASRAEAVVDASEEAIDGAVDALRDTRLAARFIRTADNEGQP